MLRACRRQSQPRPDEPEASVTLPFLLRQKSRLRTVLDDGRELALVLDRGAMLRDGDVLETEDGIQIRVRAAREEVSRVCSDDPVALARVCYHLGNRHVPLEIGAGYVHYASDHVLDGLVRSLGLSVSTEKAPFEPEGGAYGHGH